MRKYTPEERITSFWNKVAIKANFDLCWEWQAGLHKDGYGKFRFNSDSMILAHRYSWILAYGEIPNDLWVLHKCDNPKCVNPNHLFLGTHQDNVDDKVSKNRQSRRNGEENANCKFNDAQIDEIRHLYSNGGISQAELARRFKISTSQINRIVNHKSRNN